MESIIMMSIESLGKVLAKALTNSALPKIKKWYKKNSGKIDKTIENYLKESYDSLKDAKTILSRGKAIPLEDFYQPMNIIPTSSLFNDEQSKIETSSVTSLCSGRKNFLISGSGGSGKTMLFKYLFLNSIKEEYKIPIYSELRNYDNKFNNGIEEFVYTKFSTYFGVNFKIDKDEFLERTLRN